MVGAARQAGHVAGERTCVFLRSACVGDERRHTEMQRGHTHTEKKHTQDKQREKS